MPGWRGQVQHRYEDGPGTTAALAPPRPRVGRRGPSAAADWPGSAAPPPPGARSGRTILAVVAGVSSPGSSYPRVTVLGSTTGPSSYIQWVSSVRQHRGQGGHWCGHCGQWQSGQWMVGVSPCATQHQALTTDNRQWSPSDSSKVRAVLWFVIRVPSLRVCDDKRLQPLLLLCSRYCVWWWSGLETWRRIWHPQRQQQPGIVPLYRTPSIIHTTNFDPLLLLLDSNLRAAPLKKSSRLQLNTASSSSITTLISSESRNYGTRVKYLKEATTHYLLQSSSKVVSARQWQINRSLKFFSGSKSFPNVCQNCGILLLMPHPLISRWSWLHTATQRPVQAKEPPLMIYFINFLLRHYRGPSMRRYLNF